MIALLVLCGLLVAACVFVFLKVRRPVFRYGLLLFFAAILAGILAPWRARAAEQPLEDKLKAVFANAEKATAEKNIPKSDFWLARYLGLTSAAGSGHGYTDLIPLFEKREDLRKPVSFLSGDYAPEFLSFFVNAPYEFWGIPDEGIRERKNFYVIRAVSDGTYFAQLLVEPYLETWVILKENANTSRVMPLMANARLSVGRLKDGKPDAFFDKLPVRSGELSLQYVWPIELHDLEGDGVPEIWIRYNAATADGFTQMLDIYRIENDRVVFVKKFAGEAEGVAVRTADGRVLTGTGYSSAGKAHLEFDKHRLETWEFKNGKFEKVSERSVPHLLRGNAWQAYYFAEQ